MKKLIPFLSLALFTAAACNTVPEQKQIASPVEPSAITAPAQDTAGLAAFNSWKAQNELASVQSYQALKPAASTVKKSSAPVRKPSTPSRSSSSSSSQSSSSNSSSSDNAGVGSTAGTGTSVPASVEKKEGWSKAAKGAVIGGVAGAAGGAVINKKNRVLGAVIGGVLGAAGGYGIGRTMDKNDGRIPVNPYQ